MVAETSFLSKVPRNQISVEQYIRHLYISFGGIATIATLNKSNNYDVIILQLWRRRYSKRIIVIKLNERCSLGNLSLANHFHTHINVVQETLCKILFSW